MSWPIRGTYFESCNCDAICPCRKIDGVLGGRSTHGVCLGVLSWLCLHRTPRRGRRTPLPWAWKASNLVAVRPIEIDVDHTRRRQRLRIRDRVSVRIRDRYSGPESVTCVIPGHERTGEELVADQLVVEDEALAFSFRGTCGYGSTFDYAG